MLDGPLSETDREMIIHGLPGYPTMVDDEHGKVEVDFDVRAFTETEALVVARLYLGNLAPDVKPKEQADWTIRQPVPQL